MKQTEIPEGDQFMPNEEKSALIAMSGGVDSSVAAYIMKEQGYRCMGVTMRLYRNDDIGLSEFHTCCSQKDIDDASEIAFQFDIPYEVLNFIPDFKEKIIEKFIHTYETGGIPNPCIDCNRYMKFTKLFDFADENNFHYIVTGHYARIVFDPMKKRYLLKKAADTRKDQSYVLYMLTQKQLSRLLLPLGEIRKENIRKIASELKMCNAEKHDSQDICFVPDGDYAGFMEQYTGKKYPDGPILNAEGKLIGQHHGAVRYTVGQRKGLGIASSQPLYVTGKDMTKNIVYAGPESELYTATLYADDMNWISVEPPSGMIRLKAMTRYRQKEQWASVYPSGQSRVKVVFDEPQRAVTTEQAVVLYDEDNVAGGGTITGTGGRHLL